MERHRADRGEDKVGWSDIERFVVLAEKIRLEGATHSGASDTRDRGVDGLVSVHASRLNNT